MTLYHAVMFWLILNAAILAWKLYPTGSNSIADRKIRNITTISRHPRKLIGKSS